jgi:hypothetical protein
MLLEALMPPNSEETHVEEWKAVCLKESGMLSPPDRFQRDLMDHQRKADKKGQQDDMYGENGREANCLSMPREDTKFGD